MMIIDVRKLNAQKRYSGVLEFDYSAPEELIGIPFVRFSSPVKVRLEYSILEDDSVEVHGKLMCVLEGQCSRCLKSASAELEGEVDAYFQPFSGGEDYAYTGGIIDLTQAIDDAIMSCMPYTLICGKSCEGIRYTDRPIEHRKKE